MGFTSAPSSTESFLVAILVVQRRSAELRINNRPERLLTALERLGVMLTYEALEKEESGGMQQREAEKSD